MRCPSCLPIAILVAAACSAQSPNYTCDSASRLLHSASLNDKAWGAYLAARCYFPDLAAEIADQLIGENPEQLARSGWDSEGFWAAHAMTDALVRLGQPLQPKSLKEIAKGFCVEAVILMLRNAPDNVENLLEIRNSNPTAYESIAATNVLVSLRAPGLAGPLLKEMKFNSWVWVSDTGEAVAPGSAGSLGGGNPAVKIPDDLPPAALYRITSQPSPGDDLIADGGIKMYANRTQFETGRESTWEWAPEGFCYQCLRTEYISKLSGIGLDEVTSFVDRNTPIRWTNLAAVQAATQKSTDVQVAELKHLVQRLIEAKLLQPEEIDASFSITVKVEDSRADKTIRLPEAPAVSFQLP
jgi:hypothetical protein